LTTAIPDAKNGAVQDHLLATEIAMVGSGGFGFVVDLRTLVTVEVVAIAAVAWVVLKRR